MLVDDYWQFSSLRRAKCCGRPSAFRPINRHEPRASGPSRIENLPPFDQLAGSIPAEHDRNRVWNPHSQDGIRRKIEGPADVILLEPPRAGCAETAVEAMANLRPERIVYISCDPSTLARDVSRFCAAGRYTLVEVAFVDMFPQTFHIEAVVKLERNA